MAERMTDAELFEIEAWATAHPGGSTATRLVAEVRRLREREVDAWNLLAATDWKQKGPTWQRAMDAWTDEYARTHTIELPAAPAATTTQRAADAAGE